MSALTPRRMALVLLGLTALMALAALAALTMGAASMDLFAALDGSDPMSQDILVNHRLPRVATGLVVGAVLAASGAALQGLLRNALAEPFLLGVSGGAALGAALVALTGVSGIIIEPIGGFLGALTALALVTVLASRRGRIRPLDMILIGVVFNAFAGAMLMVLQALADPAAVQRVLMRLMGTLAWDPSRPETLPILAATAAFALIGLTFAARSLNVLALGDDTARSLGVRPDRLRLVLFVVLSIAIGAAVAVSGMIGFVGLIVPHAVRLVVGPDHRLLMPASALVGAAFVVLADGAVRSLTVPLGTELPVGAMTAAIGGPVFVVLLRQRGRRHTG